MSLLSKVKKLARELCYEELSDVIGQSIRIYSIDSVYEDVARLLNSRFVLHAEKPEIQFTLRRLVKYGLFDLKFRTDARCTKPDRPLRVLKSLGYLREPELEEDIQFADGELDRSIADVLKRQNYLLVFLQTEKIPDLDVTMPFEILQAGIPEKYFPRECVIVDAAITNFRGAWLWKHLYL